MKGTILISITLISLVLIATTPPQVAAFAVVQAEVIGGGVHSSAETTPCAVIGGECDLNSRCCSFNCLSRICTCVHKGTRCTIDSDCCKSKSGAKCKDGRCSA